MKARTHGRIRIEDGDKRVRAMLGGVVVADSANVKYVWEKPYYPTYYFPVADVRMDLLTPSDLHTACPCKGEASYYHVAAGDETLENHVWRYRRR